MRGSWRRLGAVLAMGIGLKLRRLFWAALGVVGFVLSPISWWNDPFVNLPLAWAAGCLLEKLRDGSFLVGFLAAYWATNLAGLILLYLAGKKASGRAVVRMDIYLSAIVSILYTLIAFLLIKWGLIIPIGRIAG